MELQVRTLDGTDAGSVTLPDEVFGLEPRADILHRMVRWQLAKRQQGTHKTKTRGEIKATTAKMYKQKGTGRARHGARTAPQFRGGGKAFGPVPRSHAHDLPKKVRALALKHALSAKAKAGAILVLDEARADEGKTKALRAQFSALGLANALVVGGAKAHGPVVRSHEIDLPKKVRRLALKHALSSKARSGDLIVLDAASVDSPKTAALLERFTGLGWSNALIIAGAEVDANLKLAARNIPQVDVLPNAGLNVYDVLRREKLVLTREAVDAITSRLTEEAA